MLTFVCMHVGQYLYGHFMEKERLMQLAFVHDLLDFCPLKSASVCKMLGRKGSDIFAE